MINYTYYFCSSARRYFDGVTFTASLVCLFTKAVRLPMAPGLVCAVLHVA